MTRKTDLQKLIIEHNRHLQLLREKEARMGDNTPTHVLTEIQDREEKLEALRTELNALPTAQPESDASCNDVDALGADSSPPRNWEKIGAIAGVVSVLIALVALATSPDLRTLIFAAATPTPAAEPSFSYQVRVQESGTDKNIPNAVVTLELAGKAPLDGITDTTGLARIFVDSAHAGQPGRLIVDVDGYQKYRREIDISEAALPKDIRLEPAP